MEKSSKKLNYNNITENNLVEYCYFWNSNLTNNTQVDTFFNNRKIKLETTKAKINKYFSPKDNIINQKENLSNIIQERIKELFRKWIKTSLKKEYVFINSFLTDKQILSINKKLDNDINLREDKQWNEYYQKISNLFQKKITQNNENIATLIDLFYDKDFINDLSQVKTSQINSTNIGKYIKNLIEKQDKTEYNNFIEEDLQNFLLTHKGIEDKKAGLKVIENFFTISETEQNITNDNAKDKQKIMTTYTINERGINFITQQIQESATKVLSEEKNLNIKELIENVNFGSYELEGKSAEDTNKKALQYFIRNIYTQIGNEMEKKSKNNQVLNSFNDLISAKGIGKKDKNSLFIVYKDFLTAKSGWGSEVNKKIQEQKDLSSIVNIINDFIINKADNFLRKNSETNQKILTNDDKILLKTYLTQILEQYENAKKVLMAYNLQGVSGVMGEIAAAIKLKLILNSNDQSTKIKITGSEENASGQMGYDVLLTDINQQKYGFQVKNYISQKTSITVYDKTSIKLNNPEALSKYMTLNDQQIIRFLLCNYQLFNKQEFNSNLNLLVKNITFKNLEDSLFYFIQSFLRINDMTIIGTDLNEEIRDTTEVNFWFLNNKIAPSSYILYKKYQQLCKYLNSNNNDKNEFGYFSKGDNRIREFLGPEEHNINQINLENYPKTTIESNLLANVKLNVSGISIPITFSIQ